jgi:hypothetical protein
LVVTIVLALVALLWTPIVVPRLVKLPTDFNTTVGTVGTFVAQAAPGSLARLPTPATLPLQVTINVAVTSADDNFVIITATQTQQVGAPTGPTQDVVLKSQYVLDRRTTKNVNDPRAWSFDPSHPVNRAGSYSFAFGFDFDPAATFPLWDDSIGTSYTLAAGGSSASADTGGLTVTGITGTTTTPADPTWVAALTPLQLPTTLTPEQWTAAGFTVTSSAPTVAVNYVATLATQVSIDNTTGATANLTQHVVTLAARPDPVATGGTPAPPQTVFISTVSETGASITTDTQAIREDGDQVKLATTTVPLALGGATAVMVVVTITLFVWGRGRRRAPETGELAAAAKR